MFRQYTISSLASGLALCLISKAGYRSGRAARGSRTMLIVGCGLAEEGKSSAEDNRQICAGYCGGIYRSGRV